MGVVDAAFAQTMKAEERAAALLAGGIMGQGYQCGMLWGAALAAGAQAYRQLGPGPLAETRAILAAGRLVKDFRQRKKAIDCYEITEMNMGKIASNDVSTGEVLKFFLKGGPIGCFSMSARYAKVADRTIRLCLSENSIEAPAGPVSCAALLAQKASASALHTVMAAGLAGGIGLCGGGCGALGAAIWLIGMQSDPDGARQVDLSHPGARLAVDQFLKAADYEFECSAITGRRFESVADHAAYLQSGGCAQLIETLATCIQQ